MKSAHDKEAVVNIKICAKAGKILKGYGMEPPKNIVPVGSRYISSNPNSSQVNMVQTV